MAYTITDLPEASDELELVRRVEAAIEQAIELTFIPIEEEANQGHTFSLTPPEKTPS